MGEEKKMNLEELSYYAHQLSQQVKDLEQKNNELINLLNQANIANLLKQLEWMWKIITTDTPFIDDSFRELVSKEFQSIIRSSFEGPNEETNE